MRPLPLHADEDADAAKGVMQNEVRSSEVWQGASAERFRTARRPATRTPLSSPSEATIPPLWRMPAILVLALTLEGRCTTRPLLAAYPLNPICSPFSEWVHPRQCRHIPTERALPLATSQWPPLQARLRPVVNRETTRGALDMRRASSDARVRRVRGVSLACDLIPTGRS